MDCVSDGLSEARMGTNVFTVSTMVVNPGVEYQASPMIVRPSTAIVVYKDGKKVGTCYIGTQS